MRNTYRAVCVLSLFFYFFVAGYTIAATNIDTSFGEDGITLQDFEIGNDEGYAIAVQDDGKILVAGYSSNGAVKDLIVSRFLEDGTLDTEFNAAGVFSISLGSGDTIGRSLTIQEDGNIIVGASSYDGSARVVVLRLTPEGNLDTSFTSDGYVLLPIEDGEITSTAVQLTESGDVVVAATVVPESSLSYAFFAKFDSSGSLDNTFGDTGQYTYTDETSDLQIKSLLIQSDSTILGGGSIDDNNNPQATLLKLTAAGAIDTTYGTDGIVNLGIGGTSSVINSMASGTDDNIIVAGAVNYGEYDEAFIAKRGADGSAISEFATEGSYKTTYSLENTINDVSITDDGKILAVGFMTSANSKDVFVVSLEENSDTLSTAATFLATDIGQNDDVGYAAVALDNETFLATGSSSNGDDLDVALLRYTSNESSLSSSGVTGTTEGIITEGFRVTTSSVHSITRVSAVSGGIIDQFSNSEEDVTVTQKGVVFATYPNPGYSENGTEDTTSTATTTDSTATTTDSAATTTDSGGGIFPNSHNSYIVRSGNTNDGDGTSTYISDVENITPGTTYYLRAYAVLSNGDVIYGNEYRFTTDDACFIATAAYGSILETQVVVLRQFRDKYLLTNSIGEHFVALYYAYSPPIADSIRHSKIQKALVKVGLIPAVLLAKFFIQTTFITKMICLAGSLIIALLLGFKYFISLRMPTT